MTAPALAVEPGSDEWLGLMTASKVAAVLGLSPWESRFSLWHRMNGTAPGQGDSKVKSRGHYLEPAIARWWADEHPEFDVAASPGLYTAPGNERHACSPDATLHETGCVDISSALEVKTAARDDDWGPEGSDDVPIYYRVQALWQCYVLDIPRVHLAVLTSFLDLRSYIVERDETDLALIQGAVADFLASLDEGRAPDIDSSTATYEVVRQLHPLIDGTDRDLSPDLARAWQGARDLATRAETHARLLNSLLLAEMGTAKRGLLDSQPIVRREARGGGAPYLKPIKTKETP